jgi:adenosylcobinamide kinase/adenosylcobinamide-phosphate guanylyltransferase
VKRIILITGGQSSGKSLYAERRALESAPDPVYLATARAEGMEERVQRHRARRGPEWTTVEEPLRLGAHDFMGRVVLVDCVTLWLTNLLIDRGTPDVEAARAAAESELNRFTAPDAVYIFVTNEVGLGGVADNALARAFADLQGRINQYIAARADEVTMVVSGIPVKIK